MKQNKVTQAIDSICACGCTMVNEIIEELEQGKSIQQTSELNKEEIQQVLTELKSIMSVYNQED